MLQKFLFIGLGGSGGKTLRMLYSMIQQRLLEADYHDGMPVGWQFLQIDVPVVPDGNTPDLPDQLPSKSYVGMAPRGLTYRDLDDLILRRGPSVVEHSGGWRPRPDRVGVDPSSGAGQYRAVGRAITAAAITNVADKIRHAVSALEDVAVNAELSRVSMRLTGRGGVSDRYPQVVLVSSIAGGSGAGSLLDVCDAVRALAPEWGDKSAALLYLPDVFQDIPAANRSGVTANALATISEIMAGYWSDGTLENEYALLESAGLPVTGRGSRGPRYPLLVGRSNGDVQFSTQTEIYRAAARALTAWTIDPAVQDSVNVAVFGNWSNTAESRQDTTRLTLGEGLENPFSALGFASIGLGRSRFARYAAERLARESIERLLRGHWTEEVPQQKTDEEAATERAEGVKYQFLERCQIREYGPHHNQVIDAVRGGPEDEAREAQKGALLSQIRSQVTTTSEADAALVQKRVQTQVRDNWEPFIDEQYQGDLERARRWFRNVQDLITHETASLLGQEGAPVTIKVLELTIKELTTKVIPELKEMSQAARLYSTQNDQRITSVFAGYDGKILGENPLIDRAITEGVHSLHAEAEALLYELCADLSRDLAENCLRPLRDAVARAADGLHSAEQGSAERPSIVKTWPQEAVPQSYQPAQNEILLESVATYPQTYRELVRASTPLPDLEGSLLQAIREVISGIEEETPTAVQRTGDWIPADGVLRTNATQRSARFQVDIMPDQLLDRARRWISRPESALGRHINESLRGYLSEDAANPQEHAERLERFRAGLKSALTASRPLIDINRAIEAKVHGSTESDAGRYLEVPTPFPFPPSHPARAVVEETFHYKDPSVLAKMFDDGSRARIEIATFLSAPSQPIIFNSLREPIGSDWAKCKNHPNLNGFWDRRRARPLPQFVAAPPAQVRAMVRGWFVARALNHVQADDPNHQPVSLWTSQGTLEFPFPLLTAPITDRGELLPALLESFALVLVGDPETALRPYWQLILLGTDDPQWYSASKQDTAANEYLRRWVAHGEAPAGAPEPRPQDVGRASDSTDERIDLTLEFLDRYQETYSAVANQRIDAHSALEVSGIWELRSIILPELEALTSAVEDLREMQTEGVW